MKVSALLSGELRLEFMRFWEESGYSQSEVIRSLIKKGLEFDKQKKQFENIELKTYFFIRELARLRGEDFLSELDAKFETEKELLIETISEGFEYVE